MNLSDTFVRTLCTLQNQPLPQDVTRAARICLLDEVGLLFAGAKELGDSMRAYLSHFDPGSSTVVGLGLRASMQNAALANGMFGHAFDFDDGHRFSTVHLGSTVIPAVLAVAEREKLSMQDVLRGIVIGYEAAIRMGNCVQPAHRARGFHSSGTIGTIGAAIGAAAALGYDDVQMKTTLSAACSSAAGMNEMMENVSTMKPYNVGRAAHDAVTAVYIAQSGFRGPLDPLEGRFGYLKTACDTYKPEVLDLDAEGGYHITGSYHKPYASCRHTHGAVYAALRAQAEGNIAWQDISAISVRMYAQGVKGHTHTDVPSPVAAKMSAPYCIAAALKTGELGILSFTDEHRSDPDIRALSEKVQVLPDDEMTAWVPKKRAARVTIETADGKSSSFQADYALGEPELPMTMESFCTKFTQLFAFAGRRPEEAEALMSLILTHQGGAEDFVRALA